jgi:NAD(P)H-flavin reductase
VHEQLRERNQVRISEARGSCFYLPKDKTQSVLMIATGTGLSPIAGIARDALDDGHSGDIYIYHGNRSLVDHYDYPPMRQLTEQYSNFHYIPCLSSELVNGFRLGRASEVALAEHTKLKSWRVYLAGNPEMVQQTKRQAYLNGASLSDILADPFLYSPASVKT